MINLTQSQLIFLCRILSEVTDEGPFNEGWASDELKELRVLFQQLMVEAEHEVLFMPYINS